eukprot:scaffold68700_cov65-Phaeocystis_antarctica.AAC.1
MASPSRRARPGRVPRGSRRDGGQAAGRQAAARLRVLRRRRRHAARRLRVLPGALPPVTHDNAQRNA